MQLPQNARDSGSATPHTRLFSQPVAKVDVRESRIFFFLFPLKQQRKKETTTRDDDQGSTHVLGFRRTCCCGNAGCAALEVRRQHARSRSCSYSIASSGRCMRARQLGAWAPQPSARGPTFTRVLPLPPRGMARGPGGRLRCLASRAGFLVLKTSAPPAGCPQTGSQRSVFVSWS